MTVLVVIVAVFLAYNANNGLPFVPTTTLKVRVANGANLVKGNEVRSGGFRIGVVDGHEAGHALDDGQIGAELSSSSTRRSARSRATRRCRSARARRSASSTSSSTEGQLEADVPATATRSRLAGDRRRLELDEVFKMFDAKTRAAVAGEPARLRRRVRRPRRRLGRTIEELPRAARAPRAGDAQPADPETDLRGFFKELGDAARIVAPVSKTNARAVHVDGRHVRGDRARPARRCKETISKSPPTLDTAIESFRVQRPFLADLTTFSQGLLAARPRSCAARCRRQPALEIGTPVQQRAARAQRASCARRFDALRDLAAAPATNAALRGLTATVTTLNPQLRFFGPYVTVCNS